MPIKKFLTSTLIVSLLASSTLLAFANVEENDQQVIFRGSALFQGDLTSFGSNGFRLIPPSQNFQDGVSLQTDTNKNLIWNSIPLVSSTGNLLVNIPGANVTGTFPESSIPQTLVRDTEIAPAFVGKANIQSPKLTGRVSVTDPSPDAQFEISGEGSNEEYFMVSNTGADGNTFVIDETGNVGIREPNPQFKLDVNAVTTGNVLTRGGISVDTEGDAFKIIDSSNNGDSRATIGLTQLTPGSSITRGFLMFHGEHSATVHNGIRRDGTGKAPMGLMKINTQELAIAGGPAGTANQDTALDNFVRFSANQSSIGFNTTSQLSGSAVFGTPVTVSSGSLVVNNNITSQSADIALTGAIKIPTSGVCDAASVGRYIYDSQSCDLRECDGTQFVTPNGIEKNFRVIFTTAAEFTGNLGGRKGADEKCQQEADAANIPGQFVALLSTTDKDARDVVANTENLALSKAPVSFSDFNFVNKCGLWESNGILRKLTTVANGGGISAPIGTESSWTGTTAVGILDAGKNCSDWTSSAANALATAGDIGQQTGSTWVNAVFGSCALPRHIYCVQKRAL